MEAGRGERVTSQLCGSAPGAESTKSRSASGMTETGYRQANGQGGSVSVRRAPELSCRQLAAWITDNQGFSVSESTVYPILRREGLVKSPEMQLKAGKEYHRKTTGPNQMWATDASYFKVIGWGY